MISNFVLKTGTAVANFSGAMEQRPFKNGRNLKSHTSRGNFLRKSCFIILATLAIMSSIAQEQEKPKKGDKFLNTLQRITDALDDAEEGLGKAEERLDEGLIQGSINQRQQRQGELMAEKIAGKWESYFWLCCDKNEGEHGGWVGPGKLEFSGNSFVLTYDSGYPPDGRYVPERVRKGEFLIASNRIEFTLENGKKLVYSFSYNEKENEITIDKKQHFKKEN